MNIKDLMHYMHNYFNIFSQRSYFFQLDVTSSQLLVTDNDFKNADFRVQLSQTVNSLLALRSIPIFNENDAISTRKAPYEVLYKSY